MFGSQFSPPPCEAKGSNSGQLGSRHLGPAEPSNASSTLIFLTATSLRINTLYKSTIHFF